MASKEQVIALHRENPRLSDYDIAQCLACTTGYVRATAQRQGLRLGPRRKRPITLARSAQEHMASDDEERLEP